MPQSTFDVVVEYGQDEFDPAVDGKILLAAERKSDYSGCGLREGMTRDIGFCCTTSQEAIDLRQKILDCYEGWPEINVCVKER